MELPLMRKLRNEIEALRCELHSKLPRELEEARAHGDLSENAEYEAAKERQGLVVSRIAQLEEQLRALSVYSLESIPGDAVGYGSEVTLKSLDDGAVQVFELVLPAEVDVAAGRISVGSPIGRALLNKELDDEVSAQTPQGKKSYQITSLRTLHDRTPAGRG